MIDNLINNINSYIQHNIVDYVNNFYQYPIKLIPVVLDLVLVIYLLYKLIKASKKTRVWQLLKGIVLLVIITALSSALHLTIINYILTRILAYGVIGLMIIFQPELRRTLEQLGNNRFTKFLGFEKDIETKKKEDVYKIVIAVNELAQTRTGALIVLEKDIKLQDIIDTGIAINADVSPQLLVNIFVPNTPLHDGAVIISENRVKAAACILPLASDEDISKALGTRHRAGLGMSKEADCVVIIVSEESGKISVAKDGKLMIDVEEDTLRQLLLDKFEIKPNTKFSNGMDMIKKKIAKKDNN